MSSRVKAAKEVNLKRVPAKVTKAEDTGPQHWLIDFGLFALIAVWSAYYNGIWDCDESMNYFEPLHHLLFGYGLQTWEYRFALFICLFVYFFIYILRIIPFIQILTTCIQPFVCSSLIFLSPHSYCRRFCSVDFGCCRSHSYDQNFHLLWH